MEHEQIDIFKVKGYADKLAQEKETDGGESKCW